MQTLAPARHVDQLPKGTDAISRLISFGDRTISALLLREAGRGQPMPEPDLVVCDAEGRPIERVRIDREPGTNRFAIVLLPA
jgi:hypothetical protein